MASSPSSLSSPSSNPSSSKLPPQLYFIHASLENPSFRIPELQSAAKFFSFDLKIVSYDDARAIILVELQDESHAVRLAERCILLKSISRLLGVGHSYPELISAIDSSRNLWEEQDMHKSFHFTVDGIFHRMRNARIHPIVEQMAFMELKGGIKMKNAEVEYLIMEEYEQEQGLTPQQELARDGNFDTVYMGRVISLGLARRLRLKFEVPDRVFYGNTSMSSEMSLLMAGQALAGEGRLVYDPFCGTGSLLYTAMHWGAVAFSSDLDGRQSRGKDKSSPGIFRQSTAFGVRDQLLDCMTFDVSLNPWRTGGFMDAIIADPPYGIRAGAKRLGRRDGRKKQLEEPVLMPDGQYAHQMAGYIPPTRPYSLPSLVTDLILFARYMLVPGGRLVFFLPSFPLEAEGEQGLVDCPQVEGMTELHPGTSIQHFGPWSRRLVTMEKTSTEEYERPRFDS